MISNNPVGTIVIFAVANKLHNMVYIYIFIVGAAWVYTSFIVMPMTSIQVNN